MFRSSWWLCKVGGFLACLACSSVTLAQGNDLSAPVGGRSALMGNTGVALARDGSAPFFNPATIVRVLDERLAFSANFYSFDITHFSNWHQPAELDGAQFGDRNLGGTGLTVSKFRVLPSTLCLFFTLADLDGPPDLAAVPPVEASSPPVVPKTKVAVCFATLESQDLDLQAIRFQGMTAAGPSVQVQSLQRRWSRTFFGPTYSSYIGEQFALGVSLHGVYAYDSFGVTGNSVSTKLGGGAIASELGTSGSGFSFDVSLQLGATYRLGALTLGLSVRAPSLHVYGHYAGTLQASATGADNGEALVAGGSGSLRATLPLRVALGVGLSIEKLTLELDGALDVPVDDALTSTLRVSTSRLSSGMITQSTARERYDVKSQVTFNPSLGAEYFTSATFSLLTGVSINLSSLTQFDPRASVGNLVQARTDHLNLACGVGSYWPGGELLFGIQLDYGWGRALAVNPYLIPNDWAFVGTQAYSIALIISGATDLSSLLRMVRRVGGLDVPKHGVRRML